MNKHTTSSNKRKARNEATAMATPVRNAAYISDFDSLPDSAMVRIAQLVRDPKHPSKPVPLPISAATLWRKCADCTFPKPVKLGSRTTAWRVSDVRAWMAAQEGGTV